MRLKKARREVLAVMGVQRRPNQPVDPFLPVGAVRALERCAPICYGKSHEISAPASKTGTRRASHRTVSVKTFDDATKGHANGLTPPAAQAARNKHHVLEARVRSNRQLTIITLGARILDQRSASRRRDAGNTAQFCRLIALREAAQEGAYTIRARSEHKSRDQSM
jgi:hypothetical protein